ncbi:IRK-interacting protein-like isoform X2 [Panicum virgatum]|uniref:IRK-interacting protein-like isoform X2 n=1 Tax=Panicum virgatum TaxID=38727 RepID=UPI0019D6303C|nr:IRK-interacting protein-like isoform X2 [Panicum virgatum]
MVVAAGGAEGFDPTAPSPSRAPASRQDVQAAIAKAVELRQLHAALLQRGAPNARAGAAAGRSPAVIRLPPVASPARSRTVDEEYPVFTPAYDDKECVAAAALNHICQDNRSRSENWAGVALDHGGCDDAALSDYDSGLNAFSSSNSEVLFPSSNDPCLRSRGAAYKIHPAFMHSAPSADRVLLSAGRASELKLPPATCNNAIRPATISSSSRVPPPSAHSRAKSRAPQILSWLFPKSRKKAKPPEMMTMPPTAIDRGNVSQLLTEWGALSLESLKKELAEAHAHRDAALREAAEVRSSLGELAAKLVSVEAYCAELKKALRQATSSPSVSRRSTRSAEASRELPMPVSHDVMVEGFLQIASEARLSVKQLCKALIQQVSDDAGDGLSDRLNLLLRPYQLALAGGGAGRQCSKTVLHHLEAVMNQAMYQDFENPAFQRGGAPRCLDPAEDRRRSFAAFVALRNLSWNEVLRKGTKYYSEDFSRFCDRKMSGVVATLGWCRPWPEQLLQCFFVAAKCVWLLHLLAFSFGPPLTILRVEDGRAFDQMYMEDILQDRQQVQSPCQVKVMVMPGFYVQDRVLKCRVLTTRSAS